MIFIFQFLHQQQLPISRLLEQGNRLKMIGALDKVVVEVVTFNLEVDV